MERPRSSVLITSSPISPRASAQELQSQQAPDDYTASLRENYRRWPTSRFYLEQLERYLCLKRQCNSIDPGMFELNFQGNANPPERAPVSNDSSFSKLVVVEGHPSPDCLSQLGNQFFPLPELFLGHLEIERTDIRDRTSYELPALPSRRTNIFHIRLITLGRSQSAQLRKIPDAETRANADAKCLLNERRLFEDRKYGATRFRRINLHNSRYFSIEQMASFSVVSQNDKPWIGLLMLDQGHELGEALNLPWSLCTPHSTNPDFLPTVRYNEAFQSVDWNSQSTENRAAKNYYIYPYHPMAETLSSHQQSLAASDPYFILSRIYLSISLSWGMILNFLDEEITNLQESSLEKARETLAQVRYNISIIQRFQNEITINKDVIEERVSVLHNDPQNQNEREIQDIFEELLVDYKYLLNKCGDLSQRCHANTNLLQGSISILESEKSIHQSAEINRLTKLASIFIPLSFCASVFGMNVREVLNTQPSIWIFIVSSVLVTLGTFSGLFVSQISQFLRTKLGVLGHW